MISSFPKHAFNTIAKHFPIMIKDAGDNTRFRCGPMKINIDWGYARGLGNVCAMRASAPLGLMKMIMLVIHPFEKDAPLFSFDYIKAMGKHTLLLELYDTVHTHNQNLLLSLSKLSDVKSELQNLHEHDLGENWYDNLKMTPSFAKQTDKKHASQLEQAVVDFLKGYLELCTKAPAAVEGNTKVSEYVNGLFENGGPSTNVFKKWLGEENARKLFEDIIFNVSPLLFYD